MLWTSFLVTPTSLTTKCNWVVFAQDLSINLVSTPLDKSGATKTGSTNLLIAFSSLYSTTSSSYLNTAAKLSKLLGAMISPLGMDMGGYFFVIPPNLYGNGSVYGAFDESVESIVKFTVPVEDFLLVDFLELIAFY
jgi:hypothetical protein